MCPKEKCLGCDDNFYNGNNTYNIKQCWLLEKAELVMKKQVGMNDVPPWNHTPIEVPNCYHRRGYWFVDASRTC